MGGEEEAKRHRPLPHVRWRLVRYLTLAVGCLLALRYNTQSSSRLNPTNELHATASSVLPTSLQSGLLATATPLSSTSPPPPAPPPVENSRTICVTLARTHQVVPGVSWGSLSDPNEQARWKRLQCDTILEPSDLLGVQTFPQRRQQQQRGGNWVQPALGGTRRAGGGGPPVVPVYSLGLAGYRVFRIPALVRAARSLLAFAEARPTVDDHGHIDLVVRKSTDGGRTWGPVVVVASGAQTRQTIGNPVPIWLPRTGELLLLFCSNAAHLTEDAIRDGKLGGTGGRRVWLTKSLDAGGNWSAPRELTDQVKRPSWTWYATGPGGALTLRNGTIVVPCTHAEGVAPVGGGADFSHVLLSHDGGASWELGGSSLDAHTNECALAQLSDGRLLLNSRDLSMRRTRVLQTSTDGGYSWSAPSRAAALPESPPRGCHGSMASTPSGERLFFAAPSSPLSRADITLRQSDDGGATWSPVLPLHRGPSAYSSMRLLPDGIHLGILYERGESAASFFAQRIVYCRVDISGIAAAMNGTRREEVPR
jgi:sialidase-1